MNCTVIFYIHHQNKETVNKPKVSIIIPSRNEEKHIAKCLNSVLASDYGVENMEIIVSDGLSTDRTRQIIEDMQKKHPNIHLIDNHKESTPHGLNAGIKASRGDYVMILGAHSEISENYISNNLKILEDDPKIGGVGGRILNAYENITSEAISQAMSSSFGVGNAKFRTTDYDGFVDTAAFAVYRREVFEQVGLFDENLIRNQDAEFNYRLRQAGYKIYLSKHCYAKYYVRASFKKLFVQYYEYGYWKIHFNHIYKKITSVRQVFPMLYVLNLILTASSWLFFMPLFYLTLSLTILHFLLALYFAFAKSKGLKKSLLILESFYILHISYGLGYLTGIIRLPFKNL